MIKERIIYLLEGYREKLLTEAEQKELDEFVLNSNGEEITEAFIDLLMRGSKEPHHCQLTAIQMQVDRITAVDKTDLPVTWLENKALEEKDKAQPSRFRFNRIHYAAAVLLIIILLIANFLVSDRLVTKFDSLANTNTEIEPGKNGAILTLADGLKLSLDSIGEGIVATQSGSKLVLKNNLLSYHSGENLGGELAFNTLVTPKGREFHLQLPDGTLVWLNAASILRYPVSFSEKERVVEVSGEAYFEVARNTTIPFKVLVNGKAEVEVLGTSFNISAYKNEKVINTTLLDGSIRVKFLGRNTNSVLLQPGQQAAMVQTSQNITVNPVQIDRVMAWRNGAFNFNGLHLEEAMRQLERWYNIEVIYEKGVPDIRLGGELGRDMSLQGLIQALKESELKCRIETGRRLIVMQ